MFNSGQLGQVIWRGQGSFGTKQKYGLGMQSWGIILALVFALMISLILEVESFFNCHKCAVKVFVAVMKYHCHEISLTGYEKLAKYSAPEIKIRKI